MPGCNAITYFNESQKMKIASAKVIIKLKLHVSVPGWPEKHLPQKTQQGKKDRKSGSGQAHLMSPARTLYLK